MLLGFQFSSTINAKKVSRSQQIIFVPPAKTTSSQKYPYIFMNQKNIKLKETQFFLPCIYWASFTTYLKAEKVGKNCVNEIRNWKKGRICFTFSFLGFSSNNISHGTFSIFFGCSSFFVSVSFVFCFFFIFFRFWSAVLLVEYLFAKSNSQTCYNCFERPQGLDESAPVHIIIE